MQDTGSKVDGFCSLPLNLSSVPFTGRFEPGCRPKKEKNKVFQYIILLSFAIYMLMRSLINLGTEACENTAARTRFWELRVSTNRQIVLIRVEEVVQVVYRHH